MTKTEKVKIHLENVGHITSLEAIELYGATRLSAIIYNLRNKYNMNIITETIEFTDRFGNAAHYAKYIFKGEENGNNK